MFGVGSWFTTSWYFFPFLEIVSGWLVPSAGKKIPVQPGWYLPPQKILRLLKTGFSRQVRELKIQKKNPGSALWTDDVQFGICTTKKCAGGGFRSYGYKSYGSESCYSLLDAILPWSKSAEILFRSFALVG
jgi:hypothetical protein